MCEPADPLSDGFIGVGRDEFAPVRLDKHAQRADTRDKLRAAAGRGDQMGGAVVYSTTTWSHPGLLGVQFCAGRSHGAFDSVLLTGNPPVRQRGCSCISFSRVPVRWVQLDGVWVAISVRG